MLAFQFISETSLFTDFELCSDKCSLGLFDWKMSYKKPSKTLKTHSSLGLVVCKSAPMRYCLAWTQAALLAQSLTESPRVQTVKRVIARSHFRAIGSHVHAALMLSPRVAKRLARVARVVCCCSESKYVIGMNCA